MRKTALAFASIFIISNAFVTVHADNNTKSDVIETNNIIEIESETELQTHIKGTEEQLANVNEEFIEFIKDIALDAHISGNDYGIYPSVIIAQAVLESSGGTSKLSESPYHNLFGVKGSYEGKSVKMNTKEDDGSGNLYTIKADFKKYPDKESSLRDHGRLLREGLDGFYSGTWVENTESPEEAAEFLQGRYATDTKYASKLIKIINDYNLKRFDEPLTNRDLAWLSSDSVDPWELPILESEENEENEKNIESVILENSRINSFLEEKIKGNLNRPFYRILSNEFLYQFSFIDNEKGEEKVSLIQDN